MRCTRRQQPASCSALSFGCAGLLSPVSFRVRPQARRAGLIRKGLHEQCNSERRVLFGGSHWRSRASRLWGCQCVLDGGTSGWFQLYRYDGGKLCQRRCLLLVPALPPYRGDHRRGIGFVGVLANPATSRVWVYPYQRGGIGSQRHLAPTAEQASSLTMRCTRRR